MAEPGPLRRLASVGVGAEMAPTMAEHVVFTNVFALVAGALSLLSSPLLVSADLGTVISTVLVALSAGTILLLNKRGAHTSATVLLLTLVLGGVGSHTLLNGFRSGGALYLLPAAVLPLLYLPRERGRLSLLLGAGAGALYVGAGQAARALDEGAPVASPPEFVTFALLAVGATLVVISYAERRVARATRAALMREREASQVLLGHLVPQPFMRRMLDTPAGSAHPYEGVTVLCSELADLASLSEALAPEQLVTLFDELFTAFDAICTRRGGVALDTVGDVYSAAFGFEPVEPEPGESRVANRPARHALDMAVEMLACVESLRADYPELELRIGLSTGSLTIAVLGLGGTRLDVFGEAKLDALRLARSGPDGRIHIDEPTMELVAPLTGERAQLVLEEGGLVSTLGPRERSLDETLPGEGGVRGADGPEGDAALGPGVVLAGAYRLGELIGRGGVGMVFRGVQLSLQREVAIKVLRFERRGSSAAYARFEREIDVVSRLSHPNIVQVIDAGRTEAGLTYLVMELLVGESLHAYVPARGLERELALALFEQICAGVRVAHSRGLIHRDLSPKNVFLVDVGATPGAELQVKLLDFGLVKTLESRTTLTRDDQIAGTPGYMAPEQINHEHEIDRYTDIYALGSMLYFMLCGQPAFEGPGIGRVVFNQLEGKHRAFEPAHEGLSELIARALRPVPSERFASVEELVEALRASSAGRSASRSFPPGAPPLAPQGSLIEGEVPAKVPLFTLSESVEGTLEGEVESTLDADPGEPSGSR